MVFIVRKLTVKYTEQFIYQYERFYFKNEYKKDDLKNYLYRNRIKSIDKNNEKTIMDKLSEGVHDADVIAWKLGVYMGQTITNGIIDYCPRFKHCIWDLI